MFQRAVPIGYVADSLFICWTFITAYSFGLYYTYPRSFDIGPARQALIAGRLLLNCFMIFQNHLFQNIHSGKSKCQTVWIQIRPDVLSCLIWVQTVFKGHQQTTLESKELIKHKTSLCASCYIACMQKGDLVRQSGHNLQKRRRLIISFFLAVLACAVYFWT